jgi:hypothetical protein
VGLSGPGSCREPPGRDTEPAPTGGSLLIEIRRGRANLHSRNSGLRPPARDHDGTASLRARSPHDPEPREAKGQRGEARVSLLERDAQTHARAYGDSLSKEWKRVEHVLEAVAALVRLPDLDVGVRGHAVRSADAATGWPRLTRSPTRTLGTTCLKIQTLRSPASIFAVPPNTCPLRFSRLRCSARSAGGTSRTK